MPANQGYYGFFVKKIMKIDYCIKSGFFFRDFPATNANKFSEKLSYGKISLSYGKISLSYRENSWIFGKFASKTWFLGGIKQFFFRKLQLWKKILELLPKILELRQILALSYRKKILEFFENTGKKPGLYSNSRHFIASHAQGWNAQYDG